MLETHGPQIGANMHWDHFGRLAFRWITSVLITWAFLAALMTATAQQRVSLVLDSRSDKLSYSAALAKANDVTVTRQEVELR